MSDETNTGFFEEKAGEKSMTRLQAFTLTWLLIFVVVWQVVNKDINVQLITLLIAAALATKHIGRYLENKSQ